MTSPLSVDHGAALRFTTFESPKFIHFTVQASPAHQVARLEPKSASADWQSPLLQNASTVEDTKTTAGETHAKRRYLVVVARHGLTP